MDFKLKKISFQSKSLKTLVLPFLLVGCSSSILDNGQGESFALIPADEMMQGPGVFSGEKGAFYVIGGDKKAKPQTVSTARPVTRSVSNMDLNETSKVLDDKIKQLQRDQMELELLKREVDRKLKN